MAGSGKHFDVIVAGGHVLDPGAGIEGDYDIGISDGRITATLEGEEMTEEQVLRASFVAVAAAGAAS